MTTSHRRIEKMARTKIERLLVIRLNSRKKMTSLLNTLPAQRLTSTPFRVSSTGARVLVKRHAGWPQGTSTEKIGQGPLRHSWQIARSPLALVKKTSEHIQMRGVTAIACACGTSEINFTCSLSQLLPGQSDRIAVQGQIPRYVGEQSQTFPLTTDRFALKENARLPQLFLLEMTRFRRGA